MTGDIICPSFQDWFCQGEVYVCGQDYLNALRCFEVAASLCPTDLEVMVYQAVCWVHLNQPDNALAITAGVLSRAPDHVQGWLFRGVALHRLGRYAESYACYNRALGQSPQPGLVDRVKQVVTRCRTANKSILTN